MKIYEKICAIAERQRMTAEDKEFIAPLADKHGIAIDRKCSNCWHDAAIQLALIYKPKDDEKGKNAGGFVLKKGIDVTLDSYRYGRFRVCEATLTEENARKWIAAGIPLRFFEQVPEDLCK